MNPFCQPLPPSVAEEMLQVVARAICDRPGDSAAQRDSRTRQMVLSTLGFEPRDGLEFMLSSLAVGHFHLILDSMSDVFHGQLDSMKAKTKTTIVALDRAMIEMFKELRVLRRRAVARPAEDARRQASEEVASPAATASPPDAEVVRPHASEPAPESVGAPEEKRSATAAASSAEVRPSAPGPSDTRRNVAGAVIAEPAGSGSENPRLTAAGSANSGLTNAGLTNFAPPNPVLATSGPATFGSATSVPATSGPANSPLANSRLAKAAPSESGRDEAGSADREPARIVPPRSHDQVPAPAKAGNRSGVFAEWQPSAVAIPPSPCEHDEGTLEDHIAAFEAALADVMETLAETQAYDTAKANAAGGD